MQSPASSNRIFRRKDPVHTTQQTITMCKPIYLFIAFLLLCLMNVADINAQSSSDTNEENQRTQSIDDDRDEEHRLRTNRRHIITWNIPPIALGKLSGGYEFMFQRNKSIKIAGGLMLPFFKLDNLENDESSYRFTGEFAISGFDLSPEIRFYMGKNAAYGRGFYLAPYLRLANYGTNGDFLRINEITNIVTEEGVVDISLGQFGGGMMIGTQTVSPGGFVFNFFFGFGIAGSSIDYRISVDGYELADYEVLEQDFLDDLDQAEADGDFGVLDSRIDPEDFETFANVNAAGFKVSLPLPVIRFGLAIGFAR